MRPAVTLTSASTVLACAIGNRDFANLSFGENLENPPLHRQGDFNAETLPL